MDAKVQAESKERREAGREGDVRRFTEIVEGKVSGQGREEVKWDSVED